MQEATVVTIPNRLSEKKKLCLGTKVDMKYRPATLTQIKLFLRTHEAFGSKG